MKKFLSVKFGESKGEEKMKESSEVMAIPGSPYQTAGSFGIIKSGANNVKSITWHTCRDRFQQDTETVDTRDFVFCHNPGASGNIIEFIRTVETVLKLDDEDCLQFFRTNSPNCLYVRLSDWWKYRVRRSLLTALMRVGQTYTEHTGAAFDKTLKSHMYLSDNAYALDTFLSGKWGSRLKKKRAFMGWYQEFHGKTPAEVNEILVRLKKGNKEKETISLPGAMGAGG